MATAARSRRSELQPFPVTDRAVSVLAQVFKLLADGSRLRVLLTLSREGEMHVSALCESLGQSQPAMSHHLTMLRMAGLVNVRRSGKFNYYRLDGQPVGEMLERLFADAGRPSSFNLGEYLISLSRSGRRR